MFSSIYFDHLFFPLENLVKRTPELNISYIYENCLLYDRCRKATGFVSPRITTDLKNLRHFFIQSGVKPKLTIVTTNHHASRLV